MTTNIQQIAILDKENISKKEVISYLEAINLSNMAILGVLKRKPALPGYEELEWVVNLKIDLKITSKLRGSKNLSFVEKSRLKTTLKDACLSIQKLRGARVFAGQSGSLEEYINAL